MSNKNYLKDLFAYRHFLIRNHMANNMVGHIYMNFAKLLIEQQDGQFMNSQMTGYFVRLDEILSELTSDYAEWIWENLDMNEIAEIDPEDLQSDFERYCNGSVTIDFVEEE